MQLFQTSISKSNVNDKHKMEEIKKNQAVKDQENKCLCLYHEKGT